MNIIINLVDIHVENSKQVEPIDLLVELQSYVDSAKVVK